MLHVDATIAQSVLLVTSLTSTCGSGKPRLHHTALRSKTDQQAVMTIGIA